MTIALVVHTIKQGTSAGVTTDAIDTSGSSLIALGAVYNSTPTLSDSKGNTWTPLTAKDGGSGTGAAQLFCAANPTVGSGHTFTSAAATSFASLSAQAFSGVATTSPFDQENGASQISGTSLATGSVTPSENNEVIVTLCNPHIGTSATINSGFTISDQADIIGGTSYGNNLAYLIQTTAGAVNPTWSWTGAAAADAAVIATFKAAAAASGGTQGRPLINSGLINHGLISAGLVG